MIGILITLRIWIVDDRTIQVHARVDIEIIEEHFDIELPEGPYESAGGFVIHALGRLAVAGDVVDADKVRFEVKSASDRHINMIRISRLDQDA